MSKELTDLNIQIDVQDQTEDALQQKCFTWFWNTFPWKRKMLFAVPNGGARDAREGARLKLTGVVAGVSDLILLHNSVAYFIELKKDEVSKQSKEQVEWQKLIEADGFEYYLIRSLTEFKELIFSKIQL